MLYIILSYPVFILASSLFQCFFYFNDAGIAAMPLRILVLVFASVLAFLVEYIFFRFAFKRVAPRAKEKQPTLVALLLILLPVISLIQYWWDNLQATEYFYSQFQYAIITILALVVLLLADLIASGLIPLSKKTARTLAFLRSPSLLLSALWFILLCSILSSYQREFDMTVFGQLGRALSYPATVLSGFFFSSVLELPAAFLPVAALMKITGAVLTITSLLGIWILLETHKEKPAKRSVWQHILGLVLVTIGVYMLVPVSRIPEPEIRWSVPATDVSGTISSSGLGIFRYMADHMRQTNIYAPYYSVCKDQNTFWITEGNRSFYSIDTDNLALSQTPLIHNAAQPDTDSCEQTYFPGAYNFPEGFTCQTQPQTDTDNFQSTCKELDYHGSAVLSQAYDDSYVSIDSLELSDNKDWALINIDYGHLYILDLRKLRAAE
jgi:hypothetical protein